MALDVPIPEPPDLSNRGRPKGFDWEESETLGSEDFYREDLDEEEVRIVDDLDLFHAFDFYRDPTDKHLRFDAPTVPEDWRERDVTESLDSSSVSTINGELHDLGRAVHETLQNYLQRTRDASDWGEERFGEREG